MRIEVTGKSLELTDPIAAHAESKAGKILKFFDGIQEIEVVLDREMREHKEEFSAEVIVHVVKHDPFVAKAVAHDVYVAIDQAVEKAGRQVHDYKEKLRAR